MPRRGPRRPSATSPSPSSLSTDEPSSTGASKAVQRPRTGEPDQAVAADAGSEGREGPAERVRHAQTERRRLARRQRVDGQSRAASTASCALVRASTRVRCLHERLATSGASFAEGVANFATHRTSAETETRSDDDTCRGCSREAPTAGDRERRPSRDTRPPDRRRTPNTTTRPGLGQLAPRPTSQRRPQSLRPPQWTEPTTKRTSKPRQQAAADRTVDRAGSASERRQLSSEAPRRTLLNSVSFSPPRTSSVNSGSLTMLKSSS